MPHANTEPGREVFSGQELRAYFTDLQIHIQQVGRLAFRVQKPTKWSASWDPDNHKFTQCLVSGADALRSDVDPFQLTSKDGMVGCSLEFDHAVIPVEGCV